MNQFNAYETLSVLNFGGKSHITLDYTYGETLEEWLERKKELKSEEIIEVIRNIINLLNAYQSKSKYGYGLLNLETIILDEKEKVYLLDENSNTGTKSLDYRNLALVVTSILSNVKVQQGIKRSHRKACEKIIARCNGKHISTSLLGELQVIISKY